MNTIRQYDTKIDIRTKETEKIFKELSAFLSSIGFYVSKDKNVAKNYPIISDHFKEGRYGDLKFKMQCNRNNIELTFYQDINFENAHGGYYDFNKYDHMPYLIKKQFELTVRKIIGFLSDFTNVSETKSKCAETQLKSKLHLPENFDINELKGQEICKDANGKMIKNGDVKYSRDWKGYLQRGPVYAMPHESIYMILDHRTIVRKNPFDLFDFDPNNIKVKVPINRMPEKYKKRMAALKESSNKELISELRRRGYKIKG